jgi:hypothetical protein
MAHLEGGTENAELDERHNNAVVGGGRKER